MTLNDKALKKKTCEVKLKDFINVSTIEIYFDFNIKNAETRSIYETASKQDDTLFRVSQKFENDLELMAFIINCWSQLELC